VIDEDEMRCDARGGAVPVGFAFSFFFPLSRRGGDFILFAF
jgi:hypothetical protein